MSESVVERLRAKKPLVSYSGWQAVEVNPHDLRALLDAVEAARELDEGWDAVNRTYTLGHPASQKLRVALAKLYSTDSSPEEG